MEKIIQPVFYASWALWLLYSYVLLLLKRNVAPAASEGGTDIQGGLGRHSVVGMFLSTIAVFSLFFLLTGDFKSDSIFFIENYHYKLTDGQKEVVIGNSVEGTDITLENPSADGRHLKLIFEDGHFEAQDISDNKRVYLNGKYLDRTKLKEGDEIEIGGKETFKVLKLGPQYPLGRSITFSIKKKGQEKSRTVTLHTLLDKSVNIRGAASLTYETRSRFLGADIYYIIVFFMIFLLCVGIYLYLKNGLNGALLLLMMASLPFGAGFIPARVQGIMILIFVPFIIYIERRRKTRWKWGSILVFLLYASVFLLPMLLRMEGDFTLGHIHSSRKNAPAIRVTGGNSEGAFELFDRREKLAYEETHEVILGHTLYRLRVDETAVVFSPVDPEKINISGDYNAIISDLSEVEPGNNYVYLKFPHEFERLPAESLAGKEKITVTGKKGNSVTLSKLVNEHYRFYLLGLIFMIAVPFWLFWFFYRSRFYRINFVVYNFVYFMLGLGYVIFGALALYNNSYYKNFSKFRDSALPLFVGLFLVFLLLSRYNRFLVFLYRVFLQKRYHVPFLVSVVLVLPVNYSPFFLIGGVLFFLYVFVFRLGRGIVHEYKNARSYPLDIKRVIETPVCSFEDKGNQRLFFGLGGILNRKGWNYLLIADLLLLLALFFIVLQLFLGGELGVSVGGFFFLPIELGKILLTLYFADWVSRIDKGMAFNVVWVYMLVLVPFGLLIFFLRDFSPLMVFAFVFFYHLVKIKKYVLLRLLLFGLGLWAIREAVVTMGNYSFPYRLFAVGFSLPILFILLRVWFKRRHGTHSGRGIIIAKKVLLTLVLVSILIVGNHAVLSRHLPVPRVLADRVNVWLNPWQDYNLSYQYVNSLWLMKGTGTYGKSADALTAAARVPLIEKDLSFTLYVSVMGMVGIGLLFLTLFLIAVVVIRRRGSRWHGYVLEFLTIIFFAQLLLPVLYVVGLLPLMGQPQPFLSYSNNLLLLFVLPFSFLMIILSQDSSQGVSHSKQKFLEVQEPFFKKVLGRRRLKGSKYKLFCLLAFLIVAFVLLRLYSISYPKDIEEETDIVYLESFHDYGSMFKLNLRDRQFFLTPLIDDMKVRGKTVSEETDIHNGDLVAIEEHTFQFKVYPGEYEYKEVYHRPLHFILPAPRSVKYIGGFAVADRRKIVADVKNHDLLKKLIVEISPEILKELAPVPGAVLEFSRDRKTGRVRLRPLVGDMLRIRDLDEKIIPKNTAVPITGGDIFKVSSFRPGSETALYFKFEYSRYEGSESLSISYRQKQDFPFAFTREPEAAILRSIDSGITYGIDITKETVFMGKQGLYSFNLDPGELMDKLYIPDKIPQGRVVDLKELLDRDMYYVENKTFVPVTFWFLNTVRKHLKKGKRELREFFEKAGVTWRDFKGYPEFDRYAGKAAALILKMRNKGVYPMYVREIKKLNKKGNRKEELKNIFRAKNNRVYLRQTQAQRPTFQKVKIPQKPVILDKEKRIAAYSSEVNGTSRRFYSSDLPPDLLPIMGSNSEEAWGLEQIFSRLYRENRLYDIRLNVNLEWQKIALAAMREMLLANRDKELNNRVYLKLLKEKEKVERRLARAGKKPDARLLERLNEIKQEISLEKNRLYEASVVLMDGRGRILTAASYPYDEETLRQLNPEIPKPYLRDANPYLNRAWKWKYNPGSTAKVLDSIAFLCSRDRFRYLRSLLSSGWAFGNFPRSDLKGSYMLNGKEIVFQLRNFREHDVPPGFCSLTDALTHSYNTYFAYLAVHNNSMLMVDSRVYPHRRFFVKKATVPVSGMYREYPSLEYAERLLMNRQINLLDNFRDTEIHPGLHRMPNDALIAIESVFPVNGYFVAEIAHYAIGQGDFQVTALQNALVASTILNDGVLYLPSIVGSVTLMGTDTRRGKAVTPDPEKHKLRVFPAEVAGKIKVAMQAVVSGGTAGGVFGDLVKERTFYAKTGTAETGVYKDNALFIGFGRLRDGSDIVFSVIVPRSGLGARVAGKLTANILRGIIDYENQRGNSL